MGFGQIVCKYSDPLPCDTCKNALDPVGKFSRTKNCFCKEYDSLDNMKPNGVLFNNEKCPHYNGTKMAQDGGPGSGNFGHAGRPGQVGGSAPGGGKGSGSLYRYEKKGVGFFSTKKDWLNGLEGERQHKAIRFIAEQKKEMKEAMERGKSIDEKQKSGLITLNEAEEMKKKLGINGLSENDPVEKYILQRNDERGASNLLLYAEASRNWDENKDRLLKQNLSEEEQKVFSYLENSDPYSATQNQLRAKAMAIPGAEPEISEELLYKSGARERPKREGPNYDFYDNRHRIYSPIETYLGEAIDNPEYGKHWDKDSFIELNKKFVDMMKYGRLSPSKCKSAINGINRLRTLEAVEYDSEGGHAIFNDFKMNPELASMLDTDEQKRLLEIMMITNPDLSTLDISKLNDSDFRGAENKMLNMALRTNDEQRIVRDYSLLMEKMIVGEVPSETDPFAAMKEAEKKAKELKRKQWLEKRDKEQEEFRRSPRAEAKQEAIKKIREMKPDEINKLGYDELVNAVKESGMMREGSLLVASPSIPVEFYRGAVQAYKNVVDRFPFLAGQLGGFGDNNPGSGVGACSKDAFMPNLTEVVIAYNKFSDLKAKEEKRRQLEADGFWSKTDSDLPVGMADVTHELGHALANWLHRYTFGDFVGIPGDGPFRGKTLYDNEVATILKERTLKALKIAPTYENIKAELSEYGAASRLNKTGEKRVGTKADEFFAECFAELMCSSKPRRVAAEFGRQLEKFIKENGITELSTATTSATMPHFVKDI